MVIKRILGHLLTPKILEYALTPERLFELAKGAYDRLDPGLPLHKARMIDQVSVVNPISNETLNVVLLEGNGIPVITPKSKKRYRDSSFTIQEYGLE